MSTANSENEERIKELETELRKTKSMLNEYRKEYEEFIMIASHDLQAPLRRISTFVERLTHKSKGNLGEEAISYTDRIMSTVTSMRSLIDNLYDLSVITDAKNDFEKCDLNKVIQEVIGGLKSLILEYKAIISTSPLPVISGNFSQLKLLFQTLVNNSLKFRKENTIPVITIESEEINPQEKIALDLPADKIFYKIIITDNGIGFDDQYAKKIFQPFYHLHGKSDYEGNGFGLSICKKIMEKHNGIISASGKENTGASFTIILPEKHN